MKLTPIQDDRRFRTEHDRLLALQARCNETEKREAEIAALLAGLTQDARPGLAVASLLENPEADLGGAVASRRRVLEDELSAAHAELHALGEAVAAQRRRVEDMRGRLSVEAAEAAKPRHTALLRDLIEKLTVVGEALALERRFRDEWLEAGYVEGHFAGLRFSAGRVGVLIGQLEERGVLSHREAEAMRQRLVGAGDRECNEPRPRPRPRESGTYHLVAERKAV
jgi:hypothetical protein